MSAIIIFLLLHFTSTVVAECSGDSCPDDQADHAELMQRHASAKLMPKVTLLQRTVTPNLAYVEDMVSDLRSMAEKQDGQLPPSEQAKVTLIRDLVQQSLLPSLQATRDDAEAELHTLIAAIGACNANSTADQAHLAGSTAVSVNTSRIEHTTCRGDENGLLSDKTTKCDDLNVFLQGIAQPATLPVSTSPASPNREAMGNYLKIMSDYYCPKHHIFETKNNACVLATSTLENKTRLCDEGQTQFETTFCMWRLELTDLCSSSQACYEAALIAYQDRKSRVETMIQQWKAEYAGLQKIMCFLDIWMSDSDVTTVDPSQAGTCDQMNVDTSPMDIAFPAVPSMVVCDEMPVAKYPCTNDFLDAEYASVPLTKACNVPPACSTTSTTMTTSMPIDSPVLAANRFSFPAGVAKWDVSGSVPFELTASIRTYDGAGKSACIVALSFEDGLWTDGSLALGSQAKLLFLRNGRLGFDIGWVGFLGNTGPLLADGQWHEVGVRFKPGDDGYEVFADGQALASGLYPVADDPAGVWYQKIAVGHNVANGVSNGDMCAELDGDIKDVAYRHL